MQAARPDPSLRHKGDHAHLLALHARLIELRRTHPALQECARHSIDCWAVGSLLRVERRGSTEVVLAFFNLSDAPEAAALPLNAPAPWRRLIDSGAPEFGRTDPFAPETAVGEAQLTIPPWGFCAYVRPAEGGS